MDWFTRDVEVGRGREGLRQLVLQLGSGCWHYSCPGGAACAGRHRFQCLGMLCSGQRSQQGTCFFALKITMSAILLQVMPLSAAPEPKRRFIPSKWEEKK